MDPKMDTGFVAPGDTFECEFDVNQPVSASQVIGIMDELLCHEVTINRANIITC
jgi:hypothetical protein